MGLGDDAVADVRDDGRDGARDAALPYGVDTLVLRMEWTRPAAAPRGYNGKMWRMRPVRGWSGGQAIGEEPSAEAERGEDHADEGVAIPIASRIPAVSNGEGATMPNADRGVTNVAVVFDPNTQGVPVVPPDGSNVPDSHSPTGLLMSPYAASGDVAERGRRTGTTYFELLGNPAASEGAIAYLVGQLAADLGHGGRFDYQRQGVPMVGDWIGGWEQSPQFRDVANFNVGLYMQQAGFTLDETLSIAGTFASIRSINKRPGLPYGLDPQTAEFIEVGYNSGTKGVFGPATIWNK